MTPEACLYFSLSSSGLSAPVGLGISGSISLVSAIAVGVLLLVGDTCPQQVDIYLFYTSK